MQMDDLHFFKQITFQGWDSHTEIYGINREHYIHLCDEVKN